MSLDCLGREEWLRDKSTNGKVNVDTPLSGDRGVVTLLSMFRLRRMLIADYFVDPTRDRIGTQTCA